LRIYVNPPAKPADESGGPQGPARTRSLISRLSHSQILRGATAASVAQVAQAPADAVLLSLSSLALLEGIDDAVDGLAIYIREGGNLSQQDQ